MMATAPIHSIQRAVFLALISSAHLHSGFLMYNFQNEKPNSKKADARKYGRSDSINDRPPKKLADVPNTMKIAGPMQHEAAKNEVNIVP